MKVANKVVCL